MLITYCLTVRLLARQQQSLCGGGGTGNAQPNGWASGWLGQQPPLGETSIRWNKQTKINIYSIILLNSQNDDVLGDDYSRQVCHQRQTMLILPHPLILSYRLWTHTNYGYPIQGELIQIGAIELNSARTIDSFSLLLHDILFYLSYAAYRNQRRLQ